MTLDEYQEQAVQTALIKPTDEKALMYAALGMNGEAGEVADKVKKILRDNDGDFSQLNRDDMTKELGDVLWYVATFASGLGISLSDVAQMNVDKLASRKSRNVLGGSGDNR